MTLNPRIHDVTERIAARSRETRTRYLDHIRAAAARGPRRVALSCGNLAHGFAACGRDDKQALSGGTRPNVAIVTAYNDMLSAHQPFERFPPLIKDAVRAAGGVAQVAGGVPAMCDGVTQGQAGMELSLFSRDVIALSAAVALSHDMFDAAIYLGVCDKIVPGLLIAALSFGHLPAVFAPAGPMPSGLPNAEKARARQLFAEGKVGRDELLAAEAKSYHSPGTCTFYGTANSNQMLMEVMGLHLPGASFVNPNTPLRDALTTAAARRAVEISGLGAEPAPVGEVIDERAIVNGVVGLHATGGSTNHTIHLIAMARAAGIQLTWDDFADLSDVVPLLTRIYPNGLADVNHFHAAGGMGFLIGELLDAGLLHPDVRTIAGAGGLTRYRQEPVLRDGDLTWRDGPAESGDAEVLATAARPFSPNGGLKLLDGNLGRGVIKISAVKPEHRVVEAPARIFDDQAGLQAAFQRGDLTGDVVAVVRFQGPRANGMPELHKLTPVLGVLQDRGQKVALVTDGRMSGASGKVPAAIHLTPEAADGGPLAKLRDGDLLRLDAESGRLEALIDTQVHFREPGLEHKEDLESGTRGAIAGGVTAVFEMPNTNPLTTSAETLADKLERAAGRAWCDYAFFMGGTGENAERLGALEMLPGCCGVKIFMGSSTGDLLSEDDETIARIMANGRRVVAVHAEDEMRLKDRKAMVAGGAPVTMHPEWRDVETALRATSRLLALAREAGRRVHVLHITTGEEMALLAANKDVATVEVTPQHLTLAGPDCYERLGSRAQMNPPIRDAAQREALWAAVADGTVDILGSDHAPHTLEEKAQPYPESPSGMTGVQTLVPVMLNHVNAGRLSLERLVDLTSAGPARVFNIAGKGRIAAGYDADFTIVDLAAERTISDQWIESRSGWTPYDGETVTGWPVATIIRGKAVMRDGERIGVPEGRPVRFRECLAPGETG